MIERWGKTGSYIVFDKYRQKCWKLIQAEVSELILNCFYVKEYNIFVWWLILDNVRCRCYEYYMKIYLGR